MFADLSSAFNSTSLANPVLAPILAADVLLEGTWRMGTGYYAPHDARAYEAASNRTYLVATVWGYDRDIDQKDIRTPEVALSCVSSSLAHAAVIPAPSPSATGSSESSSTRFAITSSTMFTLTRKVVAATIAATALSLW